MQRAESRKCRRLGLTVVHPNAAGIDVGNASHFVAVPAGRNPRSVQEFGSWTDNLHRMAAWLKSCGIRTVAMQSTGVYWMALQQILDEHGIEVYLVNAMNIRLANAINDVSGVAGMAIIRAILKAERDPRVLAKLRDARVKAISLPRKTVAHALLRAGFTLI